MLLPNGIAKLYMLCKPTDHPYICHATTQPLEIGKVCSSSICALHLCATTMPQHLNSDLLTRSYLVQALPPRAADLIDHMSSHCCTHKQSDGERFLQVKTVPNVMHWKPLLVTMAALKIADQGKQTEASPESRPLQRCGADLVCVASF